MGSLASVVQQHHLEDEAVRSYRARFESEPARFVVFENFLNQSLAERLSRFLDHEAQFATEYGLYSVDDRPVEESEWASADERDRFFRFSKLVGTPPQFSFSDNSLAYVRFRSTFQTNQDLRCFFESVTGIALAASQDFGSHSMEAGDFLKAHDDDNRNRRLALVLYLSPDWKPDYGGNLNIVSRDGAESTVDPEFNSLVAFDTRADTMHRVVPIDASAGARKRLTIGGWYHQPD